MKENFRYSLEHLGDSLVDLIDVVVETAKDSAAGVIDSIEAGQVKRKRKKVVMRIGQRAVALKSENPEMFDDDDKMVEIFTDYNSLNEALDAFMQKREERKARNKERFNLEKAFCACSTSEEAQ